MGSFLTHDRRVTLLTLTTALPAIMGLLAPDISRVTGSVVVKGRELVGLREDRFAKVRGSDVSMIFQEPMTALDPVFRVGEQIAVVRDFLMGALT